MILMVTNRRLINGVYSDEEKLNHKFDYQYSYNGKTRGKDAFEKNGKKGFESALFSELNRIKKEHNINTPKVGIYIHGYNNNYQDSIDEIVDLDKHMSSSLGYSPIIIGFSWPSSGKTPNYLSDREEVRDSIGAFTRFLLDINTLSNKNEKDCFSTTFCIAHSMGNYLLRKGMEYLSEHLGRPKGRMLFNETILIAPDIAAKHIEKGGKADFITHFSRRVHVYYSKHDRALKASSIKRFGGKRLGRHGVINYGNLNDNVVVVNSNEYANSDAIKGYVDRTNTQVSVHSSYRYHENILNDMIQVLSSIDRDQISKRHAYLENGIPASNHYRLE